MNQGFFFNYLYRFRDAFAVRKRDVLKDAQGSLQTDNQSSGNSAAEFLLIVSQGFIQGIQASSNQLDGFRIFFVRSSGGVCWASQPCFVRCFGCQQKLSCLSELRTL